MKNCLLRLSDEGYFGNRSWGVVSIEDARRLTYKEARLHWDRLSRWFPQAIIENEKDLTKEN